MPDSALGSLPIPGDSGTPSAFQWRRLWRALLRRATGFGVELFSVKLTAGQELQLHDAAGWTLVCASGAVWITQEGDARDIFLEGGEGFALDRGGLTLVRACRDAMLSIRAPAGEGHKPSQPAVHTCGTDGAAPDDPTDLAWLRSLYPERGPWNDPASYRRAGLL